MKTILNLTALSAILLSLLATSCKRPPAPFLIVDETPIFATAEAETHTIVVKSNGRWTAVVEDEKNLYWCALSSASGTNDGQITVNITENTDTLARYAVVKITMGGLTKQVLFNQEKAGYVPYKSCPCETDMPPVFFEQIESYLFRDSVPEYRLLNPASDNSLWIVFYSGRNETGIIRVPPRGIYVGHICNFPDFAKKWDIPEDGLKIYFEGYTQTFCFAYVGLGTRYSFILTNLKKR